MLDHRRPTAEPEHSHPLLRYLIGAANGRFPPADGGVTIVPPLDDGLIAVVSFTGHSVVAANVGLGDLTARGADGFGGATHPSVLLHLAAHGGADHPSSPAGAAPAEVSSLDVTLVATRRPALDRQPTPPLRETDRWDDHPRVAHARALRRDVRVHGDERGLVTLATGLAGRQEMSVAVADGTEGLGTGRAFIRAARCLVEPGVPLFAGVAPGNARSLRAFLAEGFTPIASEVLISPALGGRAAGRPGE